MKKSNAKLIIFTGPSGVGKGTILKDFFNIAGNNIIYSICCTTRKPREGEIDGVHYFFKERDEFEQLIKEDSFLEWANYSGNYYGTNKEFVENNLRQGKSVLLEIELQGAMVVMQKCPDAVSIFIKPPTFEELERRLRGRHSESEDAILKRLATAKDELRHIDIFDYVIENDKIENAVKKLNEIYRKETE